MKEDADESIGARLKRVRKQAGLTQAELAKTTGLTQSAIGNIEAGIRGYGASVVVIAHALKTDPGFLGSVSVSIAESYKPLEPK